MDQKIYEDFQNTVEQYTLRHKSILDILTKSQESSARINRAISKSVTSCGCIQINAEKKDIPENISLDDLSSYIDTHLQGELCEECTEITTEEIGKLLFYITALCNTLGLNLDEVIEKEQEKLLTLGRFNLT